MWRTCFNVDYMSKMIQIRNVPDEVHRTLKARAARAGMTLSDYLLHELLHVASRPELEDLLARIRAREVPNLSEDPAVAVRAERESHA
jgi:plasmid stability protein